MVLKVTVITLITLLVSSKLCLSYRLDGSVVPKHYKLDIVTNLDDGFIFEGKVWIKVTCMSTTSKITLHLSNLNVDEKNVKVKELSENSKHIDVKDFSINKADELYTIHLGSELEAKKDYEIFIPYTGVLADRLDGFYKSSYTEKNSKNKTYLATTQFESTYARKAFPCFDEPAFKATFRISIGHKVEYTAISNMPVEKIEEMKEKPGWSWTRFQNTVPMSTYLVAFVVSDYGLTTVVSNNVTYNFLSKKSALEQLNFAKQCSPKFLQFFEKFFSIEYPLPKVDMVAIPDFSAAAMENWGLITYRESFLLYDPKLSSTDHKDQIGSVIAHELAHQWFGNLVTMKWWTDLWLNEGFATYMAEIALEHVYPEFNTIEMDTASNLLKVFNMDSLRTSHPVSVPVGHPAEIDEIFDAISYKKGSFVIRMMMKFLGEETFRKGVTNYLLKHKYSNAEQDDLWHALTVQGNSDGTLPKNLTVKMIMDTWTLRTGFPVVSVERNYKDNAIEIKQERYLRDVIKTKGAEECWWVPVSYTSQKQADFNNTKPKYWLPCTQEAQKIEIHECDDKEWILMNIQASGLYRVNYDEKNWNLLVEQLNNDHQAIPVLNRVQLLDDAYFLAWSGYINYDIYFDMMKYLQHETKYAPWTTALKTIASLRMKLAHSSVYGSFKSYLKSIIAPVYEKTGGIQIGVNNSLEEVRFKTDIASLACKLLVGSCVDEALKLFEEYQKHPENKEIIPNDIKNMVFCTAIKHGGEKEWNFLWRQYLKSDVATEKSTMLLALGCTKELWLLQKFLETTLKNNSDVRSHDYGAVFGSVAARDVGFYIAKQFLEENVKAISMKMGSSTRTFQRYLTPLALQMNTESEYKWFENFLETNMEYFNSTKKIVDNCLETVRLNIQWEHKHAENIKRLLRDQRKKHDVDELDE